MISEVKTHGLVLNGLDNIVFFFMEGLLQRVSCANVVYIRCSDFVSLKGDTLAYVSIDVQPYL